MPPGFAAVPALSFQLDLGLVMIEPPTTVRQRAEPDERVIGDPVGRGDDDGVSRPNLGGRFA
jgi:hypothetical protein